MFPCFRTYFSILIFILLFHFLQTSQARRHSSHCNPSTCGNIRNISYPFRLRNDPQRCGVSRYELVCKNNKTFFTTSSSSHTYLVQSINYDNYTIRFADSSLVRNDTCSFPRYSQNELEFVSGHPFSVRRFDNGDVFLAQPVTFLSCKYPVKHSLYLKDDNCVERAGNSSYVKVGQLNASEVIDTCTIDRVVMVSMAGSKFSLAEMHSYLLYGFEVSWYSVFCDDDCKGSNYCQWDGNQTVCVNRMNWDRCFYFQQPDCGDIQDIITKTILSTVEACFYTIVMLEIAKYVLGISILLGLLIYQLRRRHMSMFDAIEHFLLHQNNLAPIRYSYSDTKKLTRGFREKLGQGGYGSVYKGKLRSGHYVAVKVLSTNSKSNGQDFINEVATIGRIHHVNVVKIVGYCADRSKRALIYDFMPNGSLDKYIFKPEITNTLNWEKKYEIAVGVARGIEYLHRGCDIQILHFDIKPHNILLDDNFTPKISDFGLAKFFSTEKEFVTLTAARGTIGYVAPELINRSIGGVSYKADVYSFGMLLMELVGLNRDLVKDGENSSQYFPHWIYNHLDKWKDNEARDVGEIDEIDEKITRKITIVALWCIQMSPDDRPSMGRVVEMLEECDVESLEVPNQPSYSSEVVKQQSWETGSSTTDSYY